MPQDARNGSTQESTHPTPNNAQDGQTTRLERVCRECSRTLTGRRRKYCTDRCKNRVNNRTHSKRHPEKRHEAYVRRRDRGYYLSRCRCGQSKSRAASRCRACELKASARRLQVRNAQRRYAERHRGVNPLCPNEQPCDTAIPHHHCGYCGWPIQPNAAICRICISEIERGVDMEPAEPDEEAA